MGYLRFFLALSVSVAHLWIENVSGHVAVFGFFCLSGFLITQITNEIYGSSARGKARFLLNRFLRIYPIYYMCLLIGIICIIFSPDASMHVASLVMPSTLKEWLPQIFIFGFIDFSIVPSLYPIRILHSAWSLNTEIVHYIGMCFLIGTRASNAITWLLICLMINLFMYVCEFPHTYHYFTLYAPSACFAAGAVLYHSLPSLEGRIFKLPSSSAIMLGVSLCFIPAFMGFNVRENTGYLYSCIPVFTYIIFCLHNIQYSNKDERLLADLSYPFFLLHVPVAALYFNNSPLPSFTLWLNTLITTLLLSSLVVMAYNTLFTPLRNRIRLKAKE